MANDEHAGDQSVTIPSGGQPLVDETVRLSDTLVSVRIQIVPRKTHISGSGSHQSIIGTFDLIVEAGKGTIHRVDLGNLIGSGGSNKLVFQNKRTFLVLQDLNHDGTLDTNIFHGTSGYALISFDSDARPYRLKFEGYPTGGYAKPRGVQALDVLSTRAFELTPSGFRFFTTDSHVDADWDPTAQVFAFDI